ncbi:MAG TPA: lysophospholipid acyltransferase family protein [Acidimicrobiales bacterium]|nr:lysophospholipid acyltransferase family protein [Acidimicrobiales bacterium]
MSWAPSPPPSRGDIVLYRVVRAIAVGVSRLYLPGRVLGRDNLPREGAFILAPVHRSYVDWLIVARVTTRRMRYIAKAEIWKSKIVGRMLEALGVFPVNRSGADREALERCGAVLVGGEPLVMFPEGTRRSGRDVVDLREGVAYLALRAGVPVVPVGIGGSEQSMPRGSVVPRPRRVDVVVGKPIWPPPRGVDPAGATAAAAGDGTEPVGEAVGEKRHVRVSRRATREFSDQVGAGIQEAFDEARRSAKVT